MFRKRWTPEILKRLNEQWLIVAAPWDMPEGSHELDAWTLVIDGHDHSVVGGGADDRPIAKGDRLQIRIEPAKEV
ncbi:hypothetical protein [Methylobacterium soli]|uniref:Uncharacterized protein n=1 Tax=Methylobacterium soli TaxID=553447 RepID=A0A6L3SNT9_9HYPH|nr:hypothetical protein [Methylobacterium soli]KAB1070068.1 hypothetical protein F6X53_30535 [Methylobacterium soli]GJE42080.1 hypothetical protein AEGHOMDF_1251 [Methylobacterium soli]